MSIGLRRFRFLAAAAACLALASFEVAAEDPERSDAVDWTARAKEAWRMTCQKCHAVPDTTFETDRAFLRQITETTWTGTPAEAREALIAWLENEAEGRPVAVTTAAHEHATDAQTGIVTSTIDHGDLFLHVKGKRSQRYRLRWAPGDEARERRLPAGTYVVSGYRHVRSAADGSQWIWSTSSPAFRVLEVTAGETTHCEVRRTIEVRGRAFEKDGKHRVGFAFVAEKRLGHTLYRDGRRITITWQCLDAEGYVLADGVMGYGWGGGAGAEVRPPENTAQARFVFPTPPFELVGDLVVPFELEAAD